MNTPTRKKPTKVVEKNSNIDNISDREIKLECLRLVVEGGSQVERNNPIPLANLYYDWVIGNKVAN